MATAAASQRRSSWGNVNSRQLIRNYDKSPIASPKHSPTNSPPISRNNSVASVNSFRSEPAWNTGRHHSESSALSARSRQDSTSSQASAQTTASHKKSGLKGLFHKSTKEEKEKKKKETERIIIGSRHAAAVKTKMALDPAYREFQEKHRKPSVKTAGIAGGTVSAHSSAAAQEARFPHSGSPHVHGALDMPALTRIESHDETDSDEDQAEKVRREWNTAPEHNMAEIPEVRSRAGSVQPSPWASPLQSREGSPDRTARGSVAYSIGGHSIGGNSINGHKKNSYAGGFHRDESGRWTKKTPPQQSQYHPQNGGVNADLLAASLAERLHTTA